MSDQLKIQGVVEVSTEGAESALNRVGDAAGQMAERMQREGSKAGAAVDGIGAGAEKSAEQFSRVEGRIAASIKRATTNFEMLGKTASEKLEFQIGQKGLDASKFEPMLAKLRELEAANARVGLSTGQMTQALRSVPAQMTDVVVSLASGQQPMTVLLQQGGQLKDMFGGVGAAAKAVGGYVVSMINPVTIAAAAVGGLGYAFYSARTEADEFKKNLILTGNISGLTTDRFNEMAKAMDGLSGITRGGAAEALTAMAASGNIGAGSIERLTAAALKLESAGGPAIADTVKQFESLGKEPLEASLKLNEQTRYLTLAVYEQIKALEEQGRASEAGALAQKAWADALDQRTPKMVENLGHIEKAWKGVKEAVAEAVDAAKDWGRVATPSERAAALHTQIGEIEKQLADPSTVLNRNRLKQDKQSLIAELQGLYAEIRKTHKEESEKTAAEAREQQKLAANVRWDKLAESQRSKREQYAQERKKLDADRAADLISEAKYRQAKADLAKKYEERPKAAKADKVENAYQSILDSLNKQLGSAEKLNAVEKLNVELQEKKYAKLSPMQKESLLLIAQQIDLQKRAEVEGKATLQWIADGADAQKKAVKSLNDELAKATREVATYGMSRSQLAEYDLRLIDEQIAAEKALNDEIGVGSSEVLRSLELQRSKRQEILEQSSKLDQLDAGKKAAEEAARAAQKVAAEWEKAIDRIDQTFHDGFVGMLEKGKADWESFADSIANTFKTAVADEIYKMTIKPIVVSVVSSFAGGAAQAAGSAVGQSGSGFGVLSGVQAAYGAVNGGIANAASSFAASGMGQYLGLSTAVPAGYTMGPPTAAGAYGYTAGGAYLTGSGSTLSAVAAPATAALIGTYLMAEMAKAGWGMDNNRSAGGAYASNPYLYMAYQAGSRLFGHNRNISTDAGGIQGVLDTSGFTGDRWQQFSQRGGTFRSDKRWTDTFELDSDIDSYLDSLMRQTVSHLQAIGKTLDVETVRAVEGFSHQFSLQLSENGSWEKAGEKIAGEMATVSDELVKSLVPGLADLSLFGETATQTFTRLGQEVAATDAILLAMGKTAAEAFGGVGLASIAAREQLIDLAGGLDALASKTQSFYANFYSSEEQVQLAATQAQKVLTEGFAELGQGIPATREAFRALVESQDLSTESGRKLWNSLLDLQDEFYTVAKGADATATSTKAAADKLAAATTTAQQGQASLFDAFASDAQKLAAAKKIVSDTFASIGKDVPEGTAAFLALAQSLDPAIAANQEMIAALAKAKDAFAYVQTAAAAAAAAAHQQSIDALKGQADALQGQADATASAIEALASGMGSLSPAVETLADKLTGIRDRLAASYSKDFSSGVNGLNSLLGWRSSLSDARGNLTSAIDAAQLRLPGADVAGILRGRESALWDKLRSASIGDQPKIAQQIEALFTQRLGWQADQDKAGKRNQLEESYKLATGTLTAQQEALQVQRTALTEQISAMQRLTDISHRLRDTVTSMAVDGLSSLSPAAQVQAARQAFETALSQAKSGDSEAASKLGELGNAYRQAGRTFYASSTDYANIDSSVRGALASMADFIDKSSQTSAAQLQLTALDAQTKAMEAQGKTLADSYNAQAALLDATVNTAAEEIALLTRLNDTLSASDGSVNSLIATQLTALDDLAKSMQRDGLSEALAQSLSSLPTEVASKFVQYTAPSENRDLLRQQLDAAKQQLDDEKARYTGLVAMHNEQMEQLKALNARLRAIENNAALAGAGG